MKKLMILVVLIFSVVSTFSQVSVFTKFSDNGTISPCATIFGTKEIATKIDFTYFSLVQKGWAEVMLGASYAPASWVSIGLNCGLEQLGELSFRTGGSLWLGKDKTSFLALVEKGNGNDNYWYRITGSYNLSKSFNIGARAWRFTGIGPLFEYKTGGMVSKIWAMPAYNTKTNGKNLIVGVDFAI